MKRTAPFLIALALLMSVAATASAQGKGQGPAASKALLLGSWQADLIESAKLAGKEVPPEALPMLQQMKMIVLFSADNSMTMSMSMMGKDKSESGTFKVVSTEGNTMVLKMVSSQGKTDQTTVVFTGTKASPRMTMSADGKKVIFDKSGAAKAGQPPKRKTHIKKKKSKHLRTLE